MPDEAGTRVAGVDGCKAGWVAVIRNLEDAADLDLIVFPTFADIVGHTPHLAIVAVDMPIGLPDRIGPGGWAIDMPLENRFARSDVLGSYLKGAPASRGP